jgi:hypothetical protein
MAASQVLYPCPECGWEGPHWEFSPNEAECSSCYCEFSLVDERPNDGEPDGG